MISASGADGWFRTSNGALCAGGANERHTFAHMSGAGGAVVAVGALSCGEDSSIQWAVKSSRALRAVRHIRQSSGRRVGAGRALHGGIATDGAVVAGRAHVVDRCVFELNTRLTDVTDLITRLAALVRGGNGATAAAEVALPALLSGSVETGGAAIVAGRAWCAFGYVHQAITVTISSIRAEMFRAETSAAGAVAAGRAVNGSGGVAQTVAARGAGL